MVYCPVASIDIFPSCPFLFLNIFGIKITITDMTKIDKATLQSMHKYITTAYIHIFITTFIRLITGCIYSSTITSILFVSIDIYSPTRSEEHTSELQSRQYL